MAETKPKLKNRVLLQGVKLNSLSNYINFILVIILFHILWPRNGLNRCLKCGNQKSYTEVKISGLFHTYMPILISKSLKLRSGHRLRRKKITAVPPAWFFWRDYRLVVGNLSIVPPLEPCCLPCCNFRFFCSVIVTIKVLKYLRKVFQRARMD